MSVPVRNKTQVQLPGVTGTARVERRTRLLLDRVRPGDVAVLDHLDLDRGTAQALIDAQVSAVLNSSRFLSGRYPAQGPVLLADAGVLLLDGLEGVDNIPDGARIRIHQEIVHVDGAPVALGRAVDGEQLRHEMDQARAGLASQLQTFTHNSAEFLRREEPLLLHGEGLPPLATRVAARPVVVVVEGHDHGAGLRAIRAFLKEQRPVLVGVDGGADVILRAGHTPDVVVVGARPDDSLPSVAALRAARDVVVRVDPGNRRPIEHLERLGVRATRVETTAATEDVALLLADASEASVIVGVGTHATLEDFLDRQRDGLASTYLTRLRVGRRLVDATAVPTLYSGRVRPRHLAVALLLCVLALGSALATTPVGQEWYADLAARVQAVAAGTGWFS